MVNEDCERCKQKQTAVQTELQQQRNRLDKAKRNFLLEILA